MFEPEFFEYLGQNFAILIAFIIGIVWGINKIRKRQRNNGI